MALPTRVTLYYCNVHSLRDFRLQQLTSYFIPSQSIRPYSAR
jgi:hypothetical protein